MEYIYAALLLHRLNQPVNEQNVKKVVSAAGINPDEVKVKALVSALSEVNIDEALKTAVMAPAAAPVAPAPAAQPAAETPKKEAAEEKKEEEALEGLSSLFG